MILDVRSMLAQDTHWKAGEMLLEYLYHLILYSMVTSVLCNYRSTATGCVMHPFTLGETLCKMFQLKSQRYFCALLAKARAACRVLAVSSP